MKSQLPFQSGDQNFAWDAALKLMVAFLGGFRVVHEIHTADLFSRGPAGNSGQVSLTPEAYLPNGNVTRWTASCEGVPFLGQMPLAPELFTQRGVNFGSIALQRQISIDEVVKGLTRGDWYGISIGDDIRVAHDVPCSLVAHSLKALRKQLRDNTRQMFGDSSLSEQGLKVFDAMWQLPEDPSKIHWQSFAQNLVLKQLNLMGVEPPENSDSFVLTTSVDTHAQPSPLFHLFINYYDLCRDAYNKAVTYEGEFIAALDYGGLPFYAIVQKEGKLCRVDLSYQRGDSVDIVLHRAIQESSNGRIVAVLGKSVPHLLEVWMRGPALLPAQGSAYTPKSIRFMHFLRKALGEGAVPCHGMYRVHFNALDALESVSTLLRLPPYLQRAFGKECVSGDEIAQSWREIADKSLVTADALAGDMKWLGKYPDFYQRLKQHGILGDSVDQLYQQIQNHLKQHAADVGDIFRNLKELQAQRANQAREANNPEVFSAEQQAMLKKLEAQRANQARDALVLKNNPDVFSAAADAIVRELEAQRATQLADALAVYKSLYYWHDRPFSHWVLAVPGWLDGIKRKAVIIRDPLLNNYDDLLK